MERQLNAYEFTKKKIVQGISEIGFTSKTFDFLKVQGKWSHKKKDFVL